MNIYLQELRFTRRNTILWTVALTLVAIFFLSMFASFQKDTASLTSLLNQMPAAAQDALGVSAKSFTSALGYYSFITLYLMLCGAIQAMHMGMGILAKEAAGKTGDFLLSKPVSRSAVLGAKLAAALTQLALTALVYLSVCAIVIASVSNTPTDWGLFWLMSLALFFTQVLFALMGFAIAAVARRIRGVLPLTLSIVFGFFVLSLLQGALHNEELRWLTPLKYFDVNQVLTSGGYQTGLVLAAVALAVGCVAVSWAVFTRKDIHAA